MGSDPDNPPAPLNWIPSGTSRNYDPAPKLGGILDWNKDVIPMTEATEYERDAAAIALQLAAGLRGFEFSEPFGSNISSLPENRGVLYPVNSE